MNRLELLSFAKINLGLVLLRKREDGYHDIATVFQQVDLCDRLSFSKTSEEIIIHSSCKDLPRGSENLVHRAFTRFKEKCRIEGGLEITIEKRIPMGSGLGGGSSNAAVTLKAANRLWNAGLSYEELERIAIQIGADVPFFIRGGTAFGRGLGEMLKPIDWQPRWWVVLVCPGIHVSTAWAYGQSKIALTKNEKFTNFMALLKKRSSHDFFNGLTNDLEEVVFPRHPILPKIKELLTNRDAFYTGMSGSGSAVFGLFRNKEQAEGTRVFISRELGAKAFLCKPISKTSFPV
ncbi:MAG TPA: 4-(cytidine 5'-diphospho)-2-C-methyl-D-erythritol kinase [bacterium]|nr:4-(cytidine 5'-diphospho)-2-C-methyl-D-erythritol kinase [bacterium]